MGSYTCQCATLEGGKIPDSSFTASSFFDYYHDTRRIRLNNVFGWEARQARVGEWIQIDLGKTLSLTGMATQGSGQSKSKYTSSIKIQYSTSEISNSSLYVENGRIFDANRGFGQIVTINFNGSFDARHVRVYPQTWNLVIALRVELYHSC